VNGETFGSGGPDRSTPRWRPWLTSLSAPARNVAVAGATVVHGEPVRRSPEISVGSGRQKAVGRKRESLVADVSAGSLDKGHRIGDEYRAASVPRAVTSPVDWEARGMAGGRRVALESFGAAAAGVRSMSRATGPELGMAGETLGRRATSVARVPDLPGWAARRRAAASDPQPLLTVAAIPEIDRGCQTDALVTTQHRRERIDAYR